MMASVVAWRRALVAGLFLFPCVPRCGAQVRLGDFIEELKIDLVGFVYDEKISGVELEVKNVVVDDVLVQHLSSTVDGANDALTFRFEIAAADVSGDYDYKCDPPGPGRKPKGGGSISAQVTDRTWVELVLKFMGADALGLPTRLKVLDCAATATIKSLSFNGNTIAGLGVFESPLEDAIEDALTKAVCGAFLNTTLLTFDIGSSLEAYCGAPEGNATVPAVAAWAGAADWREVASNATDCPAVPYDSSMPQSAAKALRSVPYFNGEAYDVIVNGSTRIFEVLERNLTEKGFQLNSSATLVGLGVSPDGRVLGDYEDFRVEVGAPGGAEVRFRLELPHASVLDVSAGVRVDVAMKTGPDRVVYSTPSLLLTAAGPAGHGAVLLSYAVKLGLRLEGFKARTAVSAPLDASAFRAAVNALSVYDTFRLGCWQRDVLRQPLEALRFLKIVANISDFAVSVDSIRAIVTGSPPHEEPESLEAQLGAETFLPALQLLARTVEASAVDDCLEHLEFETEDALKPLNDAVHSAIVSMVEGATCAPNDGLFTWNASSAMRLLASFLDGTDLASSQVLRALETALFDGHLRRIDLLKTVGTFGLGIVDLSFEASDLFLDISDLMTLPDAAIDAAVDVELLPRDELGKRGFDLLKVIRVAMPDGRRIVGGATLRLVSSAGSATVWLNVTMRRVELYDLAIGLWMDEGCLSNLTLGALGVDAVFEAPGNTNESGCFAAVDAEKMHCTLACAEAARIDIPKHCKVHGAGVETASDKAGIAELVERVITSGIALTVAQVNTVNLKDEIQWILNDALRNALVSTRDRCAASSPGLAVVAAVADRNVRGAHPLQTEVKGDKGLHGKTAALYDIMALIGLLAALFFGSLAILAEQSTRKLRRRLLGKKRRESLLGEPLPRPRRDVTTVESPAGASTIRRMSEDDAAAMKLAHDETTVGDLPSRSPDHVVTSQESSPASPPGRTDEDSGDDGSPGGVFSVVRSLLRAAGAACVRFAMAVAGAVAGAGRWLSGRCGGSGGGEVPAKDDDAGSSSSSSSSSLAAAMPLTAQRLRTMSDSVRGLVDYAAKGFLVFSSSGVMLTVEEGKKAQRRAARRARRQERRALIRTAPLPMALKVAVLAALVLNTGFLVSSNVSVAATIRVRTEVRLEDSYKDVAYRGTGNDLSLVESLQELWDAEAYLLALLIGALSLVWPYVEIFACLWCYLMPGVVPGTREGVLRAVEAFSKWSFVDVFVIVFLVDAFYLRLFLGVDPPDRPSSSASLQLHIEPRYGFYAFLGATLVSMVCGQCILWMHREVHHKQRTVDYYQTDKTKLADDDKANNNNNKGGGSSIMLPPAAPPPKVTAKTAKRHLSQLDSVRFAAPPAVAAAAVPPEVDDEKVHEAETADPSTDDDGLSVEDEDEGDAPQGEGRTRSARWMNDFRRAFLGSSAAAKKTRNNDNQGGGPQQQRGKKRRASSMRSVVSFRGLKAMSREPLWRHELKGYPRRWWQPVIAPLLVCVVILFVVSGFFVPVISFDVGGAAGLFLDLTEGAKDGSKRVLSAADVSIFLIETQPRNDWMPCVKWLAAMCLFFSLFFPLLHTAALAALWAVPLDAPTQHQLCHWCDLLYGWSALDVFIVALVTSATQVAHMADASVGSSCKAFEGYLELFFEEALLGDTTCYRIETHVEPGCIVLATAGVVHLMVGQLSARITARCIAERLHKHQCAAIEVLVFLHSPDVPRDHKVQLLRSLSGNVALQVWEYAEAGLHMPEPDELADETAHGENINDKPDDLRGFLPHGDATQNPLQDFGAVGLGAVGEDEDEEEQDDEAPPPPLPPPPSSLTTVV